MADAGADRVAPVRAATSNESTRNDGFRQAMLKAALDTTPQLTDENFSVWKDKISGLLELRGVLEALESPNLPLTQDENAELKLLLISKMDAVTHNNVINADNRNSAKEIWKSIKERFASAQSSNRARIFNDFLYLNFKEDAVDSFITDVRVSIKKLIDVGIDLPQDILAYLVLFKFPNSLQLLKRQIMHSDKELNVEFVCNHLTQFNNESRAETRDAGQSEAALFSGKNDKFNKSIRGSKGGGIQKSSRCTEGSHNPRQDSNHTSDSCWHLHPEKAPDWWRENQDKWKRDKDKNQVNYYMSLVTLWINHGDAKSKIILDSGASAHIFNDVKFFSRLDISDNDVIKTGKADATLPIKGTGEVILGWQGRILRLQNCLYVPDIVINLISPGCLDEKGCTVAAGSGRFVVKKGEHSVLCGTINSGQDELNQFECKSCVLAKITKQSFNNTSTTASKPFEKIHLDLIGPIDPSSINGHRYILTIVDNYSGYLAGFPLATKDETGGTLINLLENENRRLGYFPTWVCSDGGGEFVGRSLISFLDSKNVRRMVSEPYHPEHNGRAERANRSIVESMRATFDSSRIKKKFWPELLKSCCLMLNQVPKKGENDSPWEKMHGKKLPNGYVRPIGTPAVVMNSRRVKGRKFHVKGEEGQLVGFNPALLSYRILLPTGAIINSKHVKFLKKDDGLLRMSSSDDISEVLKVVQEEERVTQSEARFKNNSQKNLLTNHLFLKLKLLGDYEIAQQ
ncbi:hypothetical protein VP01_771g3 [Puccinia sorghi]|uniref:Integrase catalytic domain-containing protein n=1 Tax=Puccinia sorghi TaxID=27349 RepID=A0A0L6UCC8_9BASI|nr:hypothetical protein VP01_771g3 [Puccinia sorghi]